LLLLAALILLVSVHDAKAGPWLHQPGSLYARLGYSGFFSTQAFDEKGSLASMSDSRYMGHLGQLFQSGLYAGHALTAYLEVGVLPYLELFGSVPVVFAQTDWQGPGFAIKQSNSGGGELELGARTGLSFLSRFASSLSVSVKLPLYDNAPEKLNTQPGNSDFYDDRVALGEGTIDVNLALAGGVSWYPLPLWTTLELGARIRNRDFATGFPGSLQFGYKPIERLALMLNANWLLTADNGTQPNFYLDDYGKGPTVIDGQSYLKLSFSLMFDIWRKLALEASVGRVVAGRRTAAGTMVGAGLSYRR
jgi:hypothetical protein